MTVKVDETGEIFTSITKLTKFLNCVNSNVNWCMKYKSDRINHFLCKGYGITIIEKSRPPYKYNEMARERRRKYYQSHREELLEYTKLWRKNNPERRKELNEKWRKEHQEYYNNYYREQRRKKKEMENAKKTERFTIK